LNEFVYSFTKVVLFIVLFVGVAAIIGIPVTSFLAIFGAAGPPPPPCDWTGTSRFLFQISPEDADFGI